MPAQTRSQTKAALEQIISNSEEQKKPLTKKEEKEFIDSKGRHIKILNEDELNNLGLKLFSTYKETDYIIVVSALELDSVTCLANSVKLVGHYALAPHGYYWKAFSEKCYYWFDWYELERIPKKYI